MNFVFARAVDSSYKAREENENYKPAVTGLSILMSLVASWVQVNDPGT